MAEPVIYNHKQHKSIIGQSCIQLQPELILLYPCVVFYHLEIALLTCILCNKLSFCNTSITKAAKEQKSWSI